MQDLIKRRNLQNFRIFWDCWLYKEFLHQWLGCFWDEHDVGLHLSLDEVQIVMNKSYEVTSILLYNLNLPPDLWYKTKNILIFAILLGSNQLEDLNLFCYPLMDELKYLDENRVQAYDAKLWRLFTLRVYVTIVTRDMITLQKIIMMKGPSEKSSCRACNIYSIKSLGNE